MQRFRAPVWLAVPVILFIALGLQASAATIEINPGDTAHCATGWVPTPTATSGDCATATSSPVTPTATPQASGWHAPTTHEHGEAPPQWVLDSGHAPFTQTRESHAGYKGMTAVQRGHESTVSSYLITHILSSAMARMHGDHDYQIWVKDSHGGVSYWAGQLDFSGSGSDITQPIPTRTADDGTRPVALGERSATDGCETWYNRAGRAVIDIGWTICGRYQKFDGTVLGGVGLYRGADWTVYSDRFGQFAGAAPTLAQDCITEYGVCRLFFLHSSSSNPGPNVVPVN